MESLKIAGKPHSKHWMQNTHTNTYLIYLKQAEPVHKFAHMCNVYRVNRQTCTNMTKTSQQHRASISKQFNCKCGQIFIAQFYSQYI